MKKKKHLEKLRTGIPKGTPNIYNPLYYPNLRKQEPNVDNDQPEFLSEREGKTPPKLKF